MPGMRSHHAASRNSLIVSPHDARRLWSDAEEVDGGFSQDDRAHRAGGGHDERREYVPA